MNKEDLHAEEGNLSPSDLQTMMKNYRAAQNYCSSCPEQIQAFLMPTINLAGDMICDLCYEQGLNPADLEDAKIQTFFFKPDDLKGKQEGEP